MNKKETLFVYTNTFAASYIDNRYIKKYIESKIGSNKWTCFGDMMVPEMIGDDLLTPEFFHGIAAAQYNMILDGGTYINPLISGLQVDISMWNDIIHDRRDFFQNVMYIDIPYEILAQVTDIEENVDENTYKTNSKYVTGIVDRLKLHFYSNEAIH